MAAGMGWPLGEGHGLEPGSCLFSEPILEKIYGIWQADTDLPEARLGNVAGMLRLAVVLQRSPITHGRDCLGD